ncbi:MAG: beta-propeller fold lactonase family protein [Deltaproteobacteria bacterium]|nr:beta-propeller fold lactonase family protein [Deltaproteobacteria bacterium]
MMNATGTRFLFACFACAVATASCDSEEENTIPIVTLDGAASGSSTDAAIADAAPNADVAVALPPVVTVFLPAQGAPGDRITISGLHFAGAASTVTFNGVTATVLLGSPTELVAVVPPDATSGPITVATQSGSGASVTAFVVTSAYVYVSQGVNIAGFGLDAATGALTPLGSAPYAGVATTFAEHPSGKYLYVCSYDGSNVGAYAVNPNGALTAIGARLATGATPEVVKVHPSGKFLYAGTVSGGETSIYTIDAASGALTATTGLSFGSFNHGPAFDPSGKYFFMARNNNNDVTRFVVDPVTGLPSDPKTIAGVGGYHANVDPLGRFLFVSGWDKGGGNKLSVYRIATADGVLTKVDDYATGGTNPAGVVVSPDGKWVYVVNNISGTVAGFAVDSVSGALLTVPGSPFTVGAASWELCIDRSGRWLYVGHSLGLAGFAINGMTGALAPLAGSPFAVSGGAGACSVMRVPRASAN